MLLAANSERGIYFYWTLWNIIVYHSTRLDIWPPTSIEGIFVRAIEIVHTLHSRLSVDHSLGTVDHFPRYSRADQR